jgi:hypothetical protein
MSDQIFLAYWLGYITGNSTLEETPAGVTHVALAFAVTGPTANGDGITIDFLTQDHSEAEGLVGEQKVAMGVGNAANPGQNTPFDQVPAIAAWDPSGACKAGVMLWNLNAPEPDETALWCQTIAKNLP